MSEMHPYLVSTSCFEVYLRKGVPLVHHQPLVMGNGSLSVLADAAQYYGLALSGYGGVYSAAFGDSSVYGGVVDLFAAALQKLCCVGVFGDNAEPRGVAVKPVHRAECELGIERSKVIPESVALMTNGRVYGHTAGLVEHHKAAVFIGYRHIKARIRF